jgi:hypothetical protein
MSTITIHCDHRAEFGTKRSQVQNLSPQRLFALFRGYFDDNSYPEARFGMSRSPVSLAMRPRLFTRTTIASVMPGITITAGTAVRRSFLRLLCDSWPAYMRGSFRLIQTGRQTQHILHSCHGLRLLITFGKRNFLVGYRADPPVSKSLSQFAGPRWRNKSQLAPASK